MKINKSDVVRASKIPVPKDSYVVRVTKAEKGQSQKGFEMSVVDLEVISPESIEVLGEQVMIAGSKTRVWFLHEPSQDWGQARVIEFCEKVGMSEESQEDTDVFRQEIVGKQLNWILDSEEVIERYGKNDPNPDKRGKPLLDPDGKEISKGYRITANIQDCLSLAV